MLKKYFYHEEWNIGITTKNRLQKIDDLIDICQDKYIYWLEKKYHFQADPFFIEKNGQIYVFYEALNHTWIKGHLRCRILKVNNNKTDQNDQQPHFIELDDFALDDINALNCHLSFPFLYEIDGEIYLIPESHESQTIFLFKAIDFPKKWQKVNAIIQNQAWVDSVILKHDNLYYLISSKHKQSNRVIAISDRLDNYWQIYQKPMEIDNQHQRLGGGVFVWDNRYYLPMQENHKIEYGKSLIIKEIKPNPNWQEKQIITLHSQSKKYPDGIHTLNIGKDYIVLDAKRWQWQPFNFFIRKYRQFLTILQKIGIKK